MKRLASVTIFALLFSLIPSSASAAIKTGTNCPKLGAQAYEGGKTFTCISAGSKWKWSKGVVGPKPALIALDELNKKIYARYLSTATQPNVDFFNVTFCPGVNKKRALETIEAYKRAFKFWLPLFTLQGKLDWFLMSENDYDCWRQSVIENNNTPESLALWNKETGLMGHCLLDRNSYCGYGQGSKAGKLLQYNVIGSDYSSSPNPEVINHEVVHFYQQLYRFGFQTNYREDQMPCWYREGEANLFGMAIAFKGSPVSFRYQMISELEGVYPKAKKMTSSDWSLTLTQVSKDWDGCLRNNLGYSLGWFILEYLYQKYSLEQVQHVYWDVVAGDDWETSIKKELGREWPSIKDDVAAYLAETI
mgnify:FL=1